MNAGAEADREWEGWAEDWHALEEPVDVEAGHKMRGKVRRHTLGLFFLVIFEILLSVVALGYFGVVAWQERTVADVVLAVDVAVIVAVLWAFGLWNRRGTWRPAAESTRSFVDISYARAVAKLRTARYMPYFLIGEILLVLPATLWKVRSDPAHWERLQATWGWRVVALGVFLGLCGGALVWFKRRTQRELRELALLRRDLEDEPTIEGDAGVAPTGLPIR